MLGVGGGTDSLHAITLAGVAGLVGGALSMACGEYISVSSQRYGPAFGKPYGGTYRVCPCGVEHSSTNMLHWLESLDVGNKRN